MSFLINKKFRILSLTLAILLIAVVGLTALHKDRTSALDNNFLDGITVDSTLDTSDVAIGNGICNDGAGNCTLRAAIQEANSNPDASTILFNIQEPADFTNNSQDGYTISPASALPSITTPLTINGYSQPGAAANTAIAPAPLNGVLLIELSAANVNGLTIRASNVVVRGLVINSSEDGILADGDNAIIAGNYIGTNPLGTVAKPNYYRGVAGWGNTGFGSGVTIGGLNPEDRNLISGNGTDPQGSAIGMGPGHDNWAIQGNYIGLAADGVSEIPNAQPGGSGNPSVDYVSGTVIGGSEAGAINVISGNNGIGIAPHEAPNTRIEGNYIGTDYTGTIKKSNDNGGIGITESDGSSIINNIISGNENMGIYMGGITGITLQGNKIGTGVVGSESLGNTTGIGISSSEDVLIGGANAEDENIIVNSTSSNGIYVSDNATDVRIENNNINSSFYSNIGIAPGITNVEIIDNLITDSDDQGILIGQGSQEITVQGNEIKNNNSHGVSLNEDGISNILIGGTANGEGNIISNNGGEGIESRYVPNTNQFSAVGNSIFENTGLGITLSYGSPLANDPNDSDSGPNNLLNYPENVVYQEDGGDTDITFDLDVPAGNYRIEFFSNTAADPSGFGEGETYLSFVNITHPGGGSQSFSHTISSYTGATNLTSTTTERDSSTDGFGATSEFSEAVDLFIPPPPPPVADLSVTKTLLNPEDVTIGATLNYQLTVTNNGPESADLSVFSNVGLGGPAFVYDLVPVDFINPSNVLGDGPFPDSKIIDVGVPDLFCLYGPGPTASMFSISQDPSIGVVACWYTGSQTDLASDSSISLNLGFEVAPDSDLEFTNYAFVTPVNIDPEYSIVVSEAFSSGDWITYFTSNPLNNFAASQYPLPSEPEGENPQGGSVSSQSQNSSLISKLASSGQGTLLLIALAVMVIASSLLVRKRITSN